MAQRQRAAQAAWADTPKEKGASVDDRNAFQTHHDFDESQEQKQATLWREGVEFMEAWLERLHQGLAQPGELATLLSFLNNGVMFVASCRFLERLLETRV